MFGWTPFLLEFTMLKQLIEAIVNKSVLLFYYMPEYPWQLGQDCCYNVSVSSMESSMIEPVSQFEHDIRVIILKRLSNAIVNISVLLFYYIPEYPRQLDQDCHYNISVSYMESSVIEVSHFEHDILYLHIARANDGNDYHVSMNWTNEKNIYKT